MTVSYILSPQTSKNLLHFPAIQLMTVCHFTEETKAETTSIIFRHSAAQQPLHVPIYLLLFLLMRIKIICS